MSTEQVDGFFGATDLYLFAAGTHCRLYEKLGAHPLQVGGVAGTHFAVWAPAARAVAVRGDWCAWDGERHPLRPVGQSGIWAGFVPGVGRGALYKYAIRSNYGDYCIDKADPFAAWCEAPPGTASVVWDRSYDWGDAQWLRRRARHNALDAPLCIYEVHLGSWLRTPESDGLPGYRELAPRLADYVSALGFTHVELLPVMEHPFYASWGYQTTGYFAPTSRYGTPQDFMYLIDTLHRRGIGVILDWVPSHFPTDAHGLGFFDGTHLFEHADPRQGFHPDWKSFIFNYGRNEVRSILLSSARCWLDLYHADGLRVDGVASMLYLDYSRAPGEWIPNAHGGRENLAAVAFLRQMNERLYHDFPDVQIIAEESTAWPQVSHPTDQGGLGFGLKWDMGWMHDTLAYMQKDPIHRKYHHDWLTFRMLYAFSENFILPLSHDEVVHGKGSLLGKMPGDAWQQRANLRLLLGYMYAQPGKKLLFMGGEFGQHREWNHDTGLDWRLPKIDAGHAGLQRWVTALNRLYTSEPALYETDCDPQGFAWIDCADRDQSVLSFLRRDRADRNLLLAVFNFTPVPRPHYRLGVPRPGLWQAVLSGDGREFGGSGLFPPASQEAAPAACHGQAWSLCLDLPPLAAVFYRHAAGKAGA